MLPDTQEQPWCPKSNELSNAATEASPQSVADLICPRLSASLPDHTCMAAAATNTRPSRLDLAPLAQLFFKNFLAGAGDQRKLAQHVESSCSNALPPTLQP